MQSCRANLKLSRTSSAYPRAAPPTRLVVSPDASGLVKSLLVKTAILLLTFASLAQPQLRWSVYSTAGDVNRHFVPESARERTVAALKKLHIQHVFVEGRRGDEYVSPDNLRLVRDYLVKQGFAVSGGIATVPGKSWGVRQDTHLGWLNYQNPKTQQEIAQFFRENAAVFDEIIVDDFYCTGDTSPESEKARGSKAWGDYRRDLMVGLIDPMIIKPARSVKPNVRLIIKYPQWYDRFHMFGYDPPRSSPRFNQVWVGTEVRNPQTQRMGYVQPTEGYMNFRWLQSISGDAVVGAWFDHIECTAQNFVDQAYQSVLAGARELTLFNLGDVVRGHPGHAPYVTALSELEELSRKVRGKPLRGIAYYKPPASDADENLWLMDYLGMVGLPIAPVSKYPADFREVFLGVQAAADPQIVNRMKQHLQQGATLILTPAFVRKVPAAAPLAGVSVGEVSKPGVVYETGTPLEVDLSLKAGSASIAVTGTESGRTVAVLTSQAAGGGQVFVLNVRTFNEKDYKDTGEWLLSPKQLGLPAVSQVLADHLRRELLRPLGIELNAPSGVAFYMIGESKCFYNFRNETVEIKLNQEAIKLGANRALWKN